MEGFTEKVCDTITFDIFIAGNYLTIEESCAGWCEKGGCVSITPYTFVYTAGRELGAKITLINYARFPKTYSEMEMDAIELAKLLLVQCKQHSCSVVSEGKSRYLVRNLDTIKTK